MEQCSAGGGRGGHGSMGGEMPRCHAVGSSWGTGVQAGLTGPTSASTELMRKAVESLRTFQMNFEIQYVESLEAARSLYM